MKKILLLGLCLACLNSYAQLDLKFNSDGILQNFSNTYTKDIKSVNGAYPSILLNTNTVNFSIKYPREQSLIPNKLKNLSTNLSDSKFTDDPIFKMIFPIQTNIDTYRRGIPSPGASFYEPNPDSRFPFKAATKSYYEFLDNKGVQITSASGLPVTDSSATGVPIKNVSSFKIKREQFDNQIIVAHLNSLKKGKGFYNREWEQYKPLLNEISKQNEEWGKDIELNDFLNEGNFNINAVKFLDSLNSGRKNFKILLGKVIQDNEEWIKSWLWFTEGKIKLNPFDATDPTPQILTVEEEIKLAEEKIKLLNGYTQNHSTATDENFKLFEADLERITSGLIILRKQKEELISLKDKYNIWLNSIKQSSVILYNGILPLSDLGQINWIQHFNASKKFEFLNKTSGLPHSVADRDQMVALTHNLSKDKDVSLTSTEKLIDLEPPIVVELNPFIDAITSAFALIPNVTKVASVLKPLLTRGTQSRIEVTTPTVSDMAIKSSSSVGFSKTITPQAHMIGDFSDTQQTNKTLRDWTNGINMAKTSDSSQKIFSLLKLGKIKQADSLLRVRNNGYIVYDNNTCPKFINRWSMYSPFIERKTWFDQAKDEIVKKISTLDDEEDYFILSTLILGCNNKDDYTKAIKNYKEFKIKLKWLSEQTTPVTDIEFNKEPYTFYRTKVLSPEKELVLEKTKEVSFELFPSDTPDKAILKKTYKKHERPFFWPMGGIALIPKTRSTVVYDNTTKTFKNDTKIGNIEGYVGVKWFPGRTNITYKQKSTDLTNFGDDTNLKRGNSFLNRVSITLALGVSHSFAKNYLVGINIDPTPGIGINVGMNTFLKKGYSLENGVVVDEFTRFSKPYVFYGINIDPSIFNKIIKLFN